jgi:mannose-6-phosphate isomerase-like protein (cupin superfamily)
MVFILTGTARLTFSAIPIEQILPVDELGGQGANRLRSQAVPAGRFQQFDAPAGTVAIYPARNNHTIASIGRKPTEYFVMRFYGQRVAAQVVQKHETLPLGKGELSQTHVFPPPKGALAAWHPEVLVGMDAEARRGSPVAEGAKTEPMSDRIILAGGETVQIDSTVVPVKAEYTAAHPGCDTVLLLLSGDAHMEPSAKVLRKQSVAVVPSGVPYTLRNVGNESAVLYSARFCTSSV